LGMFINTLPLRVDVGGQGARDGVRATHARLAALLGHEHASLALAQRCSGVAAPAPLFSALLNYRHSSAESMQRDRASASWSGIEVLDVLERTNYPLCLSVDDLGEGFVLTVQAVSSVDARRVAAYAHTALEQLVDALEHRPEAPLHELSILPSTERAQLLESFNATAASHAREEATLHAWFEAQVRSTPHATAVCHEAQTLSYAELNARANRLAHRLVEQGIRPEDRVAICVERSLDMVVGLLAILKSGAAYVPVDPGYPAQRLAYMLEDSAPAAILVHAATQGLVGQAPSPVMRIDAEDLDAYPDADPQIAGLDARSLAYVIYTSGSTGQPKGVMVEHRQLVNHMAWMQAAFPLEAGDAVAQKTPFSFDASIWEFHAPLLAGGRLVLARPDGHRDVEYLSTWLRTQSIHTLQVVPTLLAALLEANALAGCPALRRVFCGGEALSARLVEAFHAQAPGVTLVNLYGPTETTIDASSHVHARGEVRAGSIIGRPIANTRIYILDAQGQPAPIGVAGELAIGGAGVARGYLHRAELTAERFVTDPFSEDPQARMYRSGDLGRWLADGSIEYLGRNDDQVKIRGFRIELGEIEARLGAVDGIKDAVVLAREDAPGDARLVGYYTGTALPVETLRASLQAQLPEHMIPAAYLHLEALPLTPNGKLDRKALPAPDAQAYRVRAYEAPANDAERIIADIWQNLLGIPRVGRHDNFFELGGHSLLAVRLIERMRQAGLQANVRTLFGQPSVASLAETAGARAEIEVPPNGIPADCERITPSMLPLVMLTQEQIDAAVAGVPGGARNVQDIYPLAPLQQGILYHHLMAEAGDPYLLHALFGFASRERLDAFVAALQGVIDRHDILRTSIVRDGLEEPLQVVQRHARLSQEQIVPEAGDVAAQLQARFDPRRFRIDLGQAPLMRVAFAHDAANRRWLAMLLFHHIALDHMALEIVQQEMQAHLLGEQAALPAALPYRNYVAQARLGGNDAAHEHFFQAMLHDIDEPTLPFGLADVQGDGRGVAECSRPVEG
ncbi:amino acid adenylation domain-containing protein, partial [Burkholderia sp. Cy-647]